MYRVSLAPLKTECRLYINRNGDNLLTQIQNMGVYTVFILFWIAGPVAHDFSLQEYCVNQSMAIKLLQSLRENNLELAFQLQVSQTCAILEPAWSINWSTSTCTGWKSSSAKSSHLLAPSECHEGLILYVLYYSIYLSLADGLPLIFRINKISCNLLQRYIMLYILTA